MFFDLNLNVENIINLENIENHKVIEEEKKENLENIENEENENNIEKINNMENNLANNIDNDEEKSAEEINNNEQNQEQNNQEEKKEEQKEENIENEENKEINQVKNEQEGQDEEKEESEESEKNEGNEVNEDNNEEIERNELIENNKNEINSFLEGLCKWFIENLNNIIIDLVNRNSNELGKLIFNEQVRVKQNRNVKTTLPNEQSIDQCITDSEHSLKPLITKKVYFSALKYFYYLISEKFIEVCDIVITEQFNKIEPDLKNHISYEHLKKLSDEILEEILKNK